MVKAVDVLFFLHGAVDTSLLVDHLIWLLTDMYMIGS
jgi:hypothetical protein